MLLATLLLASTAQYEEESMEMDEGIIKTFTCFVCNTCVKTISKLGGKHITVEVMKIGANAVCLGQTSTMMKKTCQSIMSKYGKDLFNQIATAGFNGACEAIKMC